MNRRQFLAASAAAAAAGCSRSPTPVDAAAALLQNRIAHEKGERDKHLAALAGVKVAAGAARTTPKPLADVPAAFPDLKALAKVTVRLHPRFSDEPGPDESKVGGRFLWPAGEPWPTDPERKVPLVGVMQLRAADAPPQFPFRPGTDLLQVLWCPVTVGRQPPPVTLVWRASAKVGTDLAPPPPVDGMLMGLVPVPCRVFPERVTEYPGYETLAGTAVGPKIAGWDPPAELMRAAPASLSEPRESRVTGAYTRLLAAAHGTKAGGYPRWDGVPDPPICGACKRPLDYLLTVAADEWTGGDAARWRPTEDAAADEDHPQRRATGLTTGYHVFICRRCETWPAQAALVG